MVSYGKLATMRCAYEKHRDPFFFFLVLNFQ